MTLLSVEHLDAGYFGAPVVRDLSLTVRAGEIVTLLGPNGAGKTTTLLTIIGLLEPLAGVVRLEDEDLGRLPMHRRARAGLALVPDDRAIFYGMTTRENLRLARRRGAAGEDEVLALLPELEKCLGRKAGVLSGGEQQMLALARALASRPKLLLVDEMSLGLAPVVVERLLPVLRRIAETHGTGVLFVEQHVTLALEVADRAYVMSNGRITLEAPAAELRGRQDLLESSYLGDLSLPHDEPVALGDQP
jgi:branched-chain amino acid transport system ATP-binding protein